MTPIFSEIKKLEPINIRPILECILGKIVAEINKEPTKSFQILHNTNAGDIIFSVIFKKETYYPLTIIRDYCVEVTNCGCHQDQTTETSIEVGSVWGNVVFINIEWYLPFDVCNTRENTTPQTI